MDWSKITRFRPKEFPSEKEISLTDPRLFRALNEFADALRRPVYPSPVKGTLAREYGSSKSRHYAIGKLSTAVDFFPDCDIKRALFTAVHFFGGVGLYFDTHFKGRKWIMLHGDLRSQPILWYRVNGVYKTVHTDQDYHDLIKMLG